MSLPRKRWALIGALLAAMLTTSVALAAVQQTYSQKFTAKKPNQSTGMTFTATQPGTAPVAAKSVTLTFPAGTKINSAAIPRCAQPPSCPAKSKLGSGSAVMLVAGVPITLSGVSVYNTSGGLTVVVDSGLPGVPPAALPIARSGLKLTLNLPPGFPVPVPGAGTVTGLLFSLSITTGKQGTANKPYLKTPSTCPKGNAWTFKSNFAYYDGSSKSLTSNSACVKH